MVEQQLKELSAYLLNRHSQKVVQELQVLLQELWQHFKQYAKCYNPYLFKNTDKGSDVALMQHLSDLSVKVSADLLQQIQLAQVRRQK